MKFSEVVDSLMEGKLISRSGWTGGKFMYLDKEHNWFVYYIKEDYESEDYESEDYEKITYGLDLKPGDVVADDWEIIDEIL